MVEETFVPKTLADQLRARRRRMSIIAATLMALASVPISMGTAQADGAIDLDGGEMSIETSNESTAPAAEPTMSDAEVEAMLRSGRPVMASAVTFGGRIVSSGGSTISGARVEGQNWGDEACFGEQPPDRCFLEPTDSTGTFSYVLSDGLWGIRISPPLGSSFATLEFLVEVDGNSVSARSPFSGEFYCGEDAAPCSSSTVFVLEEPNFPVVVVDQDGTPVPRAWVNVEEWVGMDNEMGWPWMTATGMETGSSEFGGTDGQAELAISQTNFYRLQINKPWEGAADVVNTSFYVRVAVGEDGSVTNVERCEFVNDGPESVEPTCSGTVASRDGRYVFVMQRPNLLLQVCAPGSGCAPVPAFVGMDYCEISDFGEFCEWLGGSDARDDGLVGLAVPESGTYRIRMERAWDYTGPPLAVTTVTVEVTLSSSGAVENVDGLTKSGDRYQIRFKAPNVVGTLTYPDDGSALAGTPVERGHIHPEVWNEEGQHYTWSPDVQGANTDEDGNFAMSLPAGDYKVRFDGSEGYAARIVYIRVDSETVACVGRTEANDDAPGGSGSVRPQAGSSCSSPQRFDITLNTPNLTGLVLAGDEPQSYTWVNVEVWESEAGYWQGGALNVDTDSAGRFAARLDTAGVYRFRFEPRWDATDYAPTSRYVVVCGSGDAATLAYADSATVATEWDCETPTSTMSSTLTSNVALDGANFVGRVVYGDQGLGDVWIDMHTCDESGRCDWEGGVNTRRGGRGQSAESQGRFGTSLVDKDTSDELATEYRVNVNPPHSSSIGVVRQSFRIYAYSDWENRNICVGEENFDDSGDVPACSPEGTYGADKPITITMTTGNMPGRLVVPGAECSALTAEACPGVGDGWIEVREWRQLPWNVSEYGWDWTENGTNSNGGWGNQDLKGTFNLDLAGSDDDTAPALYQVIGNPGWNSSDGYAKRTVTVYVDENDDWCVITAEQQSNARNLVNPYGDDGLCTPNGDNDNREDAVEGLTLELVGANIKGMIYAPSDGGEAPMAVGDAHIGLERMTTQIWCSDDDIENAPDGDDTDGDGYPDWCVGEWSEWIGGSPSAQFGANKGAFALSVDEPGNYRLRVDVPWNWNGAVELAPFSVDFTVPPTGGCGDGDKSPDTCDVTGLDSSNFTYVAESESFLAQFPAPTISGVLYDQDGAATVGGGWISIHDSESGAWVAGTGTVWDGRREGRFAASLDPGSYRVEFWPNWEDRDSGVRNIVDVVVDGDGNLSGEYDGGCPSGVELSDQDTCLRRAAIDGPVLFRADDCDSADCATRMSWAHAEALSCVDGTTSPNPDECYNWVEWADTQEDTEERPASLKMALDDGLYLVRVHPNWDQKATRPMELAVQITDGALADCSYGFGGDCYVEDEDGAKSFAADFDAVPPNVFIRVEGAGGHVVESSRYVIIESCSRLEGGECPNSDDTVEVGRYLAKYSVIREAPSLDLFLDFGDDDHSDGVTVAEYYKVTVLPLAGTDDKGSAGKVAMVTEAKIRTDNPDDYRTVLTLDAQIQS
ncbi:MAG: hypothetical protein O2925_00190 [Actinomycetota bacterium]|nr:hypothetical protein [Actinomycetota bacterium]MDA3027189.1 hypothetical protein [Actinomycetota bacterium]